jgi:LCP family protein required for cell wall assembly
MGGGFRIATSPTFPREPELVTDRRTTSTLRPRRAVPVQEGRRAGLRGQGWDGAALPDTGYRPRSRRRRRHLRTVALGVALLLVVGVVAVVVGLRYTDALVGKGHQKVQGLSGVGRGQPTNILLVGSDSRAGLDKKQLSRLQTIEVDGGRTDTIIVLHVSPRNGKAVMVSIPRDLKVAINGRVSKINAAYAGGPGQMVRTVQQVTGLPINHYVELDFAGFLKVVDAVGGVVLCNPTARNWDDRFANLHLAAHTCRKMDGVGALAYVRARHIDSDFGRIGRQQAFMKALLAKLSATGNLVNLPRMKHVADLVSDHVRTDDTFTTGDALSLAKRMRGISSGAIDMRVFPSTPGPSFVYTSAEAPILMRAIREDAATLPPLGLPAGSPTIRGTRMMVLNGSGVAGAAGQAADALAGYGVRVVLTGNAPVKTGAGSVLFYPTKFTQQAQLLGALLGPQVRVVKASPSSTAAVKGVIVLTVGTSFHLAPAPPTAS